MSEPIVKSGRVFAIAYTYSGGAVTATKLYFQEDETPLILQGHLQLPTPVSLEITYLEQSKQGHKLVSLVLLGGQFV